MAAENKKNSDINSPFGRLSQEAAKSLQDVEAELDKAEAVLEDMKELGLDTSRLEERIAWGRKASAVIKKHFG